jgi:hypothetical protein
MYSPCHSADSDIMQDDVNVIDISAFHINNFTSINACKSLIVMHITMHAASETLPNCCLDYLVGYNPRLSLGTVSYN